jgi:3-oxoacyl-[acyl-carrier-protein] synthase-3
MNSIIKAISFVLPSLKVTNNDLSIDFPEWSPEKISNKTGIFQRSVCSSDEYASDLAFNAATKLFIDFDFDKNNIDFLLYCTQSPDYFLPTTACLIQDRLNLKTSCGALDFNLGCSGFVYGLSLATGLISSGNAKNILLITSETYSKFLHPLDKSNRSIFGDAAAATLISGSSSQSGIEKFVFGTDGSGASNLIIKNGGGRFPNKNGVDIYENSEFIKNDDFLFMNGQEIFKYTTSGIPKLVYDCLEINNFILDEIDLFIFHQANKFMLDYIRRKLNIAPEKFYISLELTGNTVSSTIPIAISEAIKSGKLVKGMKVLLAGFGVGYSSAATIFTY